MTDLLAPRVSRAESSPRSARLRRYAMTRPDFFEVRYAINPWMHPNVPVDRDRALAQWDDLRRTYLRLGHRVDVIEPVPGLPDMVYAANGALVAGGHAIAARFAHSERAAEAPAFAKWLEANGLGPAYVPTVTNEGEGDFLVVGSRILAGTGFRTSPEAHVEVARVTGLEVVTLQLVDPRYYHLDTAVAVLDDDLIAYYPGALSAESGAVLRRLYPDAIVATEADAAVLGLNAVSDGRNVVLTDRAPALAAALEARGFVPVPVDLSELLLGGGGVKCCTLEIRR